MANEQLAKNVDFLWDGWFNSLKSFQQLQDDIENKTLQAFNYQKELLDSTVSTLQTIENESKKASKEYQEKLQSTFNELNKNGQIDQVSNWIESVQEITDKAQHLAWKPSNTIFELITTSQLNWEATVKNVLDQQKHERDETFTKIEELTSQMKETHKKLLAVNE